MSLAARLQKKAQKAIAKYGEALTLTHRGATTYDPETSGAATTLTTTSLKGLVAKDNSLASAMVVSSSQGSDVRVVRRKVTVAALDLPTPPAVGDTLSPIEGATAKVVGVDSERVEGQPITYDLRVTA